MQAAPYNIAKYQHHKFKALNHFWRAQKHFERAARHCPEQAGEIAQFYHNQGKYDASARFYEKQVCVPALAESPRLLRRIGREYERYAQTSPIAAAATYIQKAGVYFERAHAGGQQQEPRHAE